MDQDQRRWSKTLSNPNSRRSSSSSKRKSHSNRSMELNARDRYKHDLEQADAMRGVVRGTTTTTTTTKTAVGDVELGLKGLDDADVLAKNGELEKALDIYNKAIELLLQCLKSPSSSLPKNVQKDVVASRVRVALSEAEDIKARLKSQQDASQSTQESPKQTSTWESLSSSLAAALTGSPSPTTAKSSSPSSGNQATSPSARKPQPVAAVAAAPRQSPVSSAQHQRQRRTKLDYDKDPYVQTIKSDLYVDTTELQSTTWNDIAGLETAKRALQESAILPLVRPDLYTGLRKPQNILLYGPPGTGKTMLVRAVAYESQCLLFSCTASSLTSKWHGEGEKLVRTLFQVARDVAPSLIFVDEMDALLSSRKTDEHEASRRFKTEFMIQLDGINSKQEQNVLCVGATNTPWDIDDAVMRRFPKRVYIPMPDSEARRGLLQSLLQKAGKHNLSKSNVDAIVQKTQGFSCSDIASIASEASFGPLRSLGGMDAIRDVKTQDVRPISVHDFDAAIQSATKSVTPALLAKYIQWEQQQT